MSLALPPVPERDQQQLPDGVYEMTEPEADLESDAELSVPRFESDISLTEGGLADKYFLKYRSYHKPITILKPTDHCYGQGPSPSPGPAGSSGGVGGTEARHTLLVLHILPGVPSYYEEISLKSLLRGLDEIAETLDESVMARGAGSDNHNNSAPVHMDSDTGAAAPSNADTQAQTQVQTSTSYLVSRVNYRDLRRLEYKIYPTEAPSIIVRRHCVLFLFDPLRAVILADRLMLVVPDGADLLLQVLESHVRSWNPLPHTKKQQSHRTPRPRSRSQQLSHQQPQTCQSRYPPPPPPSPLVVGTEAGADSTASAADNDDNDEKDDDGDDDASASGTSFVSESVSISFEVRCYESLLATVQELYAGAHGRLGEHVARLLTLYAEDTEGPSHTCKLLTLSMQREMQRLKDEINALSRQLEGYKRGLWESLLEEEDSMALMNLAHLAAYPQDYLAPASETILGMHEPIEILLEASVMDYNSALNGLDLLSTKLMNAEAMQSLQLSVSRNALLALNTKIAILGAAMAFGGFMAGVFGMNLSNVSSIQDVPHTFEAVTLALLALVAAASALTTWWFTATGVLPVYDRTK